MNGLFVIARADASGLASMSIDFCKAMRPDVAIVVDSHGRGRTLPERIDATRVVSVTRDDLRDFDRMRSLWRGCTALVSFETWYYWPLAADAKHCGLKTILFPMWECTPAVDVMQADVVVCLSDVDAECYSTLSRGRTVRHDWPIDSSVFVRMQPRTDRLVFGHNCGTFGLNNRNNSDAAIAACASVKEYGCRQGCRAICKPDFDPGVPLYIGDVLRECLFKGIDVFVFPTGIEGLCLPISEAASLGIPTVVMDLPQWKAWPDHMRVPVKKFETYETGAQVVRYARPDVDALKAIVRDLATGKTVRASPPRPPSWDDFKAFWRQSVME